MPDRYRSPKIYAIIFGVLLFTVLLMVVCFLSETIKTVGAPFLFLPEKLGLIEVASREQVVEIEMSSGSTVLDLLRSGKYAVYTKDYDLLVISDSLREVSKKITNVEDVNAWLTVRSVDTGKTVPVGFIYRGLMPFDSSLAQGRPVLNFEIAAPGKYELKYSSRKALMYVLPDYTSGKESRIYLIYLVETAILLVPIWKLYSVFSRRRKAKEQEIQDLKHIRGEGFWESEFQKKKDKEKDTGRSTPRFR